MLLGCVRAGCIEPTFSRLIFLMLSSDDDSCSTSKIYRDTANTLTQSPFQTAKQQKKKKLFITLEFPSVYRIYREMYIYISL